MYHETFVMFAGYNRWANDRLYAVVGTLGETERNSDRGLFFGSLMGTLNHILAADRIWMRRFTGTGEAPERLDAILHTDFEPLHDARRAEDARIASWIDEMDDAAFAESFSYSPITNPRPVTQRLAPAVFHLFNHQTHHRGQCHAALTAMDRPSVVLDMITFQREIADANPQA